MKKIADVLHMKYMTSAAIALALLCGSVPAFAYNNTQPPPAPAAAVETLKLDDAVAAAIAASGSLKNYEDNIPIAEKNISDLYDALMETTTNADYVKIRSQVMQAESKRDIDALNAQTTRQQLTVSVWQAFESVVSARNALALYDQSLGLQKRQLDISKVRLRLGLMSQLDFNTADSGYKKAVSDRVAKASAVDTAYMNLNKLLGRGLSRRYDLIFSADYEPMAPASLGQDVQAAIDANTTVMSLQNNIKITQYQIRYYDDSVPQAQTLAQLNASVSGDTRSLADAKTAIEQKLTAQNAKILQQEASFDSQKAALDAQLAQLNAKKTQLRLGMTTQIDADTAAQSVASQEESLRALTVDHAIAVMQYQWPNTL